MVISLCQRRCSVCFFFNILLRLFVVVGFASLFLFINHSLCFGYGYLISYGRHLGLNTRWNHCDLSFWFNGLVFLSSDVLIISVSLDLLNYSVLFTLVLCIHESCCSSSVRIRFEY